MAEISVNPVPPETESPVTVELGTEILDRAHELACLTGSEVVVILTCKDRVISYATPALQPLLGEESGRAIIVKCLFTKLQTFLPDISQPFGISTLFFFIKI
eukprot:TRINITY_DN2909_c0_g2_i5.p1 TRINITY_DN2909_c0_g2~~TRINITY_DN2909_c0_g2_i5.p1  ORF type:complete len:120 (-),score=24.70 TRINITY_DN2909_c0_g2_i5:397-702(-)